RQICRRARTHISPTLFRSSFTGTVGVELRPDALVVSVPAMPARERLQGQLNALLTALAQRTLHRPLVLHFISPPPLAPSSHPLSAHVPPTANGVKRAAAVALRAAPAIPAPNLNPRYTFASFIVGESNRLAYAAGQSIASMPGRSYNPLFLYGGVGLGKTHLLMAIGHELAERGLRVAYVTSETFTNEIVDAIQHNTQEEFRGRYRAIDALLIDDIQFIGGKERTEEEFFHTFNALHNANKQIIITSDRLPRTIPTLHERLRSRFEWGLMADVATPDFAHRLEILRVKAAEVTITIPPIVLEYIARPEGSSVRQLEGALNRLVMMAHTRGSAVTLALAATALRECFGERGRIDLSPTVVLDLVANHYHVSADEMLGKGRVRSIAWPRQVAMYLLREETENSLAQIGAALGGRDHTTIMHGCEQVGEMLRTDEQFGRELETLRSALRSL
nr:chromosomal replication initiator protein DnaA [Ktedonobacterales bacterium]